MFTECFEFCSAAFDFFLSPSSLFTNLIHKMCIFATGLSQISEVLLTQ